MFIFGWMADVGSCCGLYSLTYFCDGDTYWNNGLRPPSAYNRGRSLADDCSFSSSVDALDVAVIRRSRHSGISTYWKNKQQSMWLNPDTLQTSSTLTFLHTFHPHYPPCFVIWWRDVGCEIALCWQCWW